MHEEELDSAT